MGPQTATHRVDHAGAKAASPLAADIRLPHVRSLRPGGSQPAMGPTAGGVGEEPPPLAG